MMNFKRYKNEILKLLELSSRNMTAVKNGTLVLCEDIKCSDCDIFDKSGEGGCVPNLIKWLYEDDGETEADAKGCSSCKHLNRKSDKYPCSGCKRSYIDKFEPNPKKTRLLEFLEHYPDADLDSNGIPKILPCRIDTTYLTKCKPFDECGLCEKAYWLQEVEE